MRLSTAWHSALAISAAAFALACSDVAPEVRPNAAAVPRTVDAELVVSDLAPRPGSEVIVLTRMRLGSDVGRIASFTARVAYDSTRLRLLGEQPLADAATRMLNPTVGEARVAGFATDGFADAQLFALRFSVLQNDALAALQVAFDELHGVDGSDLQKRVHVAATPVPGSLR